MNCRRLSLFVVSMVAYSLLGSQKASVAEDRPKPPTPITDTTGIAHDKLFDFLLAAQAIKEHRYCVVVRGYRTVIKADGPAETELIRILATDPKKKLRLDASALVENPLGRRSEAWSQLLTVGTNSIYRGGSPNGRFNEKKFSDATDEDDIPKMSIKPIDPFEDAVLMAHEIGASGRRQMNVPEKLFVHGLLEFTSAKFSKEGDIETAWQNVPGKPGLRVDLILSKKHGYMPTRVRFAAIHSGKPTLMSDSMTYWEKVGDRWLPVKRIATSLSGKTETHYELNYRWKLEDSMPVGTLDPDLADWREPIRVLFDEDWVRPGRGIIRLPEELQSPSFP